MKKLWNISVLISTLLGCQNGPTVDECPRALAAGIKGPNRCEEIAVRDRRYEFDKANNLRSSCKGGGYVLECSGVTDRGQPIKFKCDSSGCEWIPGWLW
jgi:hypothetical protein